MDTRWKAILAVMVIICALCSSFIWFFSNHEQQSLQRIISSKQEGARLLAENILTMTATPYRSRIRSFLNYEVSRKREEIIQAFAELDRSRLLRLTRPFFRTLKQESPYFASMGWILPDNTVFLRVHRPDKFGDNVSEIRKDIATVNREHRQVSGFAIGPFGLQYRIVEPVYWKGKHIGALQFGIKASLVMDTLQQKLGVPTGLLVPNQQCSIVRYSNMPKIRMDSFSIRSREIDFFRQLPPDFSPDDTNKKITLDNRQYVLVPVIPITTFAGTRLADIILALDISDEVREARSARVSLVLISLGLVFGSLLILYFSFGHLIRQITSLNEQLQSANRELEKRVQQRSRQLEKEIEERKKAQKLETIGLTAGSVAHDLNNILSGVVSYPDLLLLQLPQDSPLRKPISEIQQSGKRAAAVVSDLLAITRHSAKSRKISQLNNIVTTFLESPEFKNIRKEYPLVQVKTDLAPLLKPIVCSPIHIQKMLMNLVINGMEALDGQGSIRIATRNVNPEAADSDGEQQEYVLLEVADDGPGIPEEALDKIFEPFYTKKNLGRKSGTGLGLTVVWSTVEDHNGIIRVESDSTGTVFSIYLPATEGTLPDQEEQPEPTDTLHGSGCILVVDDEEQQIEIASKMLTSLGYTIVAALSGEEALDYLKKHPVDLVLLDMIMGTGWNGLETYQRILTIRPDQKTIIVSGYAQNEDVQEALSLGVKGFLKKPYLMDELGRLVREALRS